MVCSPLSDSSSVSVCSVSVTRSLFLPRSLSVPFSCLFLFLCPPAHTGVFLTASCPLLSPWLWLSRCCLRRQEARHPPRAPPRSLSLSPQVLPMTPPGRLYLLRVCSAPLLLLLGLLLALPPEAQVRQQENGGCRGAPAKLCALESRSTLLSPRGFLGPASHPQLPGLPTTTLRSTWRQAPSNLLLILLVNITGPPGHVPPALLLHPLQATMHLLHLSPNFPHTSEQRYPTPLCPPSHPPGACPSTYFLRN